MKNCNYNVSEHADKIHRNCTIVDGHFDILADVAAQREKGRRKVIETDYLNSFIKGGVNIVVASIFIDAEFVPEMALRKALGQISALYAEIDESPDSILICRDYSDILRAQRESRIGFVLSFEGAEPLGNEINLLRVFYELGVRGLGLTWSRRNYAGDGCRFVEGREGKRGGITDFGLELIETAETLGMFIDVSHLNDEGFEDVMRMAKGTVIASHSNCRSIAGSMRNLTDEQIKSIASKGGVIGMNGCSNFVDSNPGVSDAKRLLNHIDHIVELVGVSHVGIGLDICGIFDKHLSTIDMEFLKHKSYDVIKNHEGIKELTVGLVEKGYSDDDLKKILGGNFMRVFREVL